MTQEQLDALLAAQDGGCAVCHRPPPLKLDHNHATGEVRGLLCHWCNTAEGLLQGDPERVERLAEYLRNAGTGLQYESAATPTVQRWLDDA